MSLTDLYATSGTVADPKALARDLAATLMKIERVPDIRICRRNTAAFVHDLADGARSSVERNSAYVRVQVFTDAGALDDEKQIAVVRQLTALIADAAGDSSLTDRIWVLLTEAPQGGWGLWGHAHLNDELVAAARAEIAMLQAGAEQGAQQ